VVAGNAITRAGCWSHARRKFVEAEKSAAEIAREAVDLMGQLFAVEKQAKDVAVAERHALRQTQSVAVLAELRRKLLAWKEQLLPKHPMAEAVNYTLGQWEELTVFTRDGAVPIDNNVSERELKRVVLNRKNSLFVGNPRGGRTAAILASLTSSCRRHEMDLQLYFMQLLMNLPSCLQTTSTPGFPIAGNKLTLPGARLWKYPLSILETVPHVSLKRLRNLASVTSDLGMVVAANLLARISW
jgi:hypothetical protein